jgi:Uma2 family endonuclease
VSGDAPPRDEEAGRAEPGRGAGRTGGGAGGGPLARRDFTHWPVPVGGVTTRDGLTFVHSPARGGYSVEDFQTIPDGRVELLDGVVVVRPELTPAQRRVVGELYQDLCDRCPEGLTPSDGRLDVRAGRATVFRPDFQVLSRDGEDAPRLLVAEARPDRGPAHRAAEREAKLRGYRDAGIPSYWAIDPDKSTVAVYETRYVKRGSFRCEQVCARGQRYWWRPWAKGM